jgi:CheY-like chemotaxis protein
LSEVRGLTQQILEQTIEQVRDQEATLSDLASRIEPAAGELADVWSGANREALTDQPPTAGITPPDMLRDWLSSLRQRNWLEYFSHVTAWTRQMAAAGLPYDRSLKLAREYQRRAIPFLMRVYPPGPELEAALDAFDELFDACMVVIGAVYIEALQERALADSRPQILGEVFGGAAHALNNLLSVVLARMTVLIEQTHVAEERDELLYIQQTAAAGAQMLRRLQDFVKSDRAEKPVAAEVNLIMRDAMEITRFIWRDQAETAGIVIDVVKDFADVPPVLARLAALREAFVIMIVNAVNALPQGGLITLRTERQGDTALVSVVNSGQVTEATRAEISAPTFTPIALPQTGVALIAAARLAGELGGRLTVETVPGRGTTYTLSLPLAKGINAGKEKAEMPAQPADVLFIDNEEAVRDAFTRLLSLYGHRVTTVENGEKGLAVFKAGKFDVVFTDLGMPGMSGWDVAREIKKLNAKALVVLVTGWPIDLHPEKSKETGVDRVVTKPLDMPQVLGLIDDAVALRGK